MSLTAHTEWLRSNVTAPLVSVDRENKVIRGYVVAQSGPFKTPGRGEFDEQSLRKIVKLINATPKGLKSRFAHPSLSEDGIGKFLGRARDARLDKDRVRANLHLDPSSFSTPSGDLGGYVMDLAETDPDAFSSSLVLRIDKIKRTDKRGRPEKDEEGNDLPPLWRPTELHASDVVDEGDAVDGFLSADSLLPDAVLRRGAQLLDQQFPGATREVVEARCLAFLGRYLDWRYADEGRGARGQRRGEKSGEGSADRDPGLLIRRRALTRLRGKIHP